MKFCGTPCENFLVYSQLTFSLVHRGRDIFASPGHEDFLKYISYGQSLMIRPFSKADIWCCANSYE